MIKKESFLNVREPKARPNRGDRGGRGSGSGNGGLTLVYGKNGNRIEFSTSILKKLNNPTAVSIKFDDNHLIISKDEENGYILMSMSKRKVIYNIELIKEVISIYDISFDGHVCKTFSEIEEVEDIPDTVVVKMRTTE